MMESFENTAFFYTPITPEKVVLTIANRQLAWVGAEVRLKAMIKNMTKMANEDDWPA